MKLDDETYLSAYLDGELDPPRRLVVEAALLSQPQLAERLQELTAVRSLVDGLVRPTVTSDQSGPVLRQIASQPWIRLRRLVRHRLSQRRYAAAAATVALAASLLVALGLRLTRHDQPQALRTAPLPNAAPVPPRPDSMPDSSPSLANSPANRPAARSPVVPYRSEHREIAALDQADRISVRAHEKVRRMLDRPGARRITLVLDSIGPDELRKVEDAIDRTRRGDPTRAKIRIGQGMVIDPARPKESVVYLVVMNDQEHSLLRENLGERLPEGAISEDDDRPSPAIVTQLADVGQIEFAPGNRVPALAPPPAYVTAEIAQRHDRDPAVTEVEPMPVPASVPKRTVPPSNHPSVVQQRGREADDAVRARENRNPAGDALVYLVWVTTSGSG